MKGKKKELIVIIVILIVLNIVMLSIAQSGTETILKDTVIYLIDILATMWIIIGTRKK